MRTVSSLFRGIEIAASGLTAQRVRLDIIANNIANAETTRTERGTPYRRQLPIFQERTSRKVPFSPPFPVESPGEGVRVVKIVEDPSPFRKVYQPGHPDADKDGYVLYPNVNVVLEMADMIDATRAYEANLALITNNKQMIQSTIQILR